MWCANCRSDVAAEVSTDNRHVNCANCGGPIATPLSGRTLSRTQQARELLERWSRDRAPEPAVATAEAPKPHVAAALDGVAAAHASSAAAGRNPTVYAIKQDDPPFTETAKPHHRIDSGHQPGDASDHVHHSPPPAPQRRHDPGHAVAGPHFATPKPPMKWVAAVGQSLAYVGVLGLMAGACLVILGYFRGPASYAPTGWLITMAGQMLLFLGVVTLVSTGMEETTNTVANRIDRLDEKLLRIEQAATQMRGPNVEMAPSDSGPAAAVPRHEISRAG